MLIDSHCHLLSSCYDDVKKEIEKAFSCGVDKLIINGYDVKTSHEAVELAKKYGEDTSKNFINGVLASIVKE